MRGGQFQACIDACHPGVKPDFVHDKLFIVGVMLMNKKALVFELPPLPCTLYSSYGSYKLTGTATRYAPWPFNSSTWSNFYQQTSVGHRFTYQYEHRSLVMLMSRWKL